MPTWQPSVTLGENDTLSGGTEVCNGVPPGINPNVSIGTYTSEEPMEVDINNDPNETLFGVTDTGIGVTVLLHGVTNLNSLDHSYSRQSLPCTCEQAMVGLKTRIYHDGTNSVRSDKCSTD